MLLTMIHALHSMLMTAGPLLWAIRPSAGTIGHAAALTRTILTGYHAIDGLGPSMPLITSHSSAFLAVAALACAALLSSILSRAKQSKDIVVLELMLGSITAYFLALAGADALPTTGADAHRHAYILRGSAEILRLLFYVFGGHFLALTHRATIEDPDRPREPPVFSSGLQEKHLPAIWIALTYALGVAVIGLTARAFFTTLATYTNWTVAAPLPPHGSLTSFLFGVFGGICFTIQLQILSNLAAQVRGSNDGKPSFFGSWRLTSGAGRVNNKYVVGFALTKRPSDERLNDTLYRPDEWHAFLVLLIGTIGGMLLANFEHFYRLHGADEFALWTLAIELLPLAVLLPLTYYKTRFLFFDALIKRGLLALILLSGLAVLMLAIPEHTNQVVIWAVAWVLAMAFSAMRPRMDRAIDRYLFHRPNYETLQREIGEELRQFDDANAAIAHVCQSLAKALRLAEVRFTATGDQARAEGTLSVPMYGSNGQRTHGWLQFGERPRQEPYQSEDLKVLSAIAAQLGATLDHIEQARREHELRELAVRAELKALKAQINPHFFFNALNTVADLTQSNPAAAEKTILNLARIFQFALEASRQETVTLGREVAFVRSYLEIEKARFEEKLEYAIDVPDELADLPVPPMLVQPLVENAVRHGISPKQGPGRVTVRAKLREKELSISIEDDGVGFEPSPRATEGIGMANVAARVERLAGPGHWRVESSPGAGARVSFDLPVAVEVKVCVS